MENDTDNKKKFEIRGQMGNLGKCQVTQGRCSESRVMDGATEKPNGGVWFSCCSLCVYVHIISKWYSYSMGISYREVTNTIVCD